MTMEHAHGTVISLKRTVEEPDASPVRHEPAHVHPKSARKGRLGFVLVTLAMLLCGMGIGYVLRQPEHPVSVSSVQKAGTGPIAHTETEMVRAVEALMYLPEETPSVATVTDLAPLESQAFFAHAQVGDVLLMFPQARKAVLYRPATNKLIEVAPLTLSE